MKDFAKSIRTMNSNKEEIIKKKKEEGSTLKVDNGQKLEFSDGTTYVKTSFSEDYSEAKNYTGNRKVGNGIEISGVIGKLPPDSEISKEIYEELKKNNYDKDKTVLSLSIKYKVMPNARMFFEDAVEKVIKSYKNRTVNESIEKQEWSMFKGLTKDAEKEIGNSFEVGTHITIQQNGKEYDVKVLKDMPSKVLVKGPNGAVIEVSKTDIFKVGNSKIGNETAEEKKFGKVMREFDRGELKSGSGETVTNPEQAKAIAYSESEKVDNLKRARNKMAK